MPPSMAYSQQLLRQLDRTPATYALTGLGIGASSVVLYLASQQSSMSSSAAAWQTADQEEEMQEVLTDNCAEAAPWLSHPQAHALVTGLAGGLSGAAAKTAVAPLARLTILYQVQALQPPGAKAPSLLSAMQQVVRQEGLRALWKGNLATVIHRVPYSAANFSAFEASKSWLEPHMSNDVLRRLVSGGFAGLVACTAAYPLDLVRTRLSAQRDMLPRVTRLGGEIITTLGMTPDFERPTTISSAPIKREPPNYRGIIHAFKCIVREEGYLGLYRGLGATLLQVTPSLALNFCLYDSFRAMYVSHLAARGGPQQQQQQQQDVLLSQQHAVKQPDLSSESHSSTSQHGYGALSQHKPVQGSGEVAAAAPGLAGQGAYRYSAGGARQAGGRRPGEAAAAAAPAGAQPVALSGSLLCASAAGLVTSTVTFPLDVVRKRTQTYRGAPGQRPTYLGACAQILNQQGWKGFYAGIVPEYCKVLPGMMIAFAMYEGIRGAFGVHHKT